MLKERRAGLALGCAAALGLGVSTARADLNISGYLKDFNVWSQTLISPEYVTQNVGRARLQFDERQKDWGVYLAYDQQYLSGSLLSSKEVKQFGIAPPQSFLNLDWTVKSGYQYAWETSFYRAYFEADSDPWTVRIGRQRINWGTGKIWQPTDILNPYQPLSIENDERRGVDALYMRRALGALDQFEFAYAPLNGFTDTMLLTRVHQYFDLADMDVSIMGGKAPQGDGNTILGGDFSTSFGQGLGYGEWSYTHASTIYWRYLTGFFTKLEDFPIELVNNADIVFEYYHNGNGATDPLHYNFADILNGRDPWPVRDALGVVFTKNLHPLIKVSTTDLWDLNDAQVFASGYFEFDIATDLQVTVGVQSVQGGTISSLDFSRRVYYIMGQYFFGAHR